MSEILFVLKQALGNIVTILCGFAIGIGICKMCEYIDNLFEILKRRG